MAEDQTVEKSVNKLVQIFPTISESQIRDVLSHYWKTGQDVQKSLRRSVAWLQIAKQLEITPVSIHR